ncbi:ribbon-helix-helix domain-containing protein [Clostridium tarantellae]|uniref:ribbon-helix-helix domain-containing protein n=1 Tax=Clostridium tarantellae TaxID=39493 RepID=UPI0014789BF3|nr:ribbon-helix-helix domain-containing protein [Clostridium tarantellae]
MADVKKAHHISFKMTKKEKDAITNSSKDLGFNNISVFLRECIRYYLENHKK